MPTYVFINNDNNGDIEEHTMKIAELGTFKKDNPHLSQTIADVRIGDPVALGRHKIDPEFKDVLKDIGRRTPGGQGLTDYVNNSEL